MSPKNFNFLLGNDRNRSVHLLRPDIGIFGTIRLGKYTQANTKGNTCAAVPICLD